MKKTRVAILFLLLTLFAACLPAAAELPAQIYWPCLGTDRIHNLIGYSAIGNVHHGLYQCTYCGKSFVTAHPYEEHSGGTETPTCTTGKTCALCGAEYGILGHDWSAWTPNGDGTHTRRCKRSNCDAVDNAAPCSGGTATCTAKAVCEACGGEYGEKDPNNHALEQRAAKAPTCTETGWDAYEGCTRSGCNYTTYHVLPALKHNLVRHVAKAPTCTEIGWNAYETWSRCDYTTYTELPALNHDYQAVTVDPTCEADGCTVFTCSRCKDSYTADPTDKLGHQFGAWSPNGIGSQSAGCLRQGCAHTGSTDCRKFTFRIAEGETLTFCPVCGQAENAAQLEKIEAATAWAASGSLSAEDVTARTNGEYLSVAFETAGSLTQPTGRVRLALPAGLLEGKTLVRIAPDGTQTELPFEAEHGKLLYTLDFADSELPVMLFRLAPQTTTL